MKNVNPSPAAVGGHFDPVQTPTGPLDKATKAAPVSQIVPDGDPINEVKFIPENTADADPKPMFSGKPKPAAQGGVY